MIKYLKHQEIVKPRWDEAIDRAFNGIIYAKSWYLDIVSPHWDALVSDDYSAVMPLTWRRKFGVYYLYQPFFTQQLGVFGDEDQKVRKWESEKVGVAYSPSHLHTFSPAHFLPFLNAIPKKFKFIEIQLNHANEDVIASEAKQSLSNKKGIASSRTPRNDGVGREGGFQVSNRITHHLDLNQSYEKIKSGYSENLSRNIKRAEKSNLQFIDDFEADALIGLFRSTKGAELKELSDCDYLTFDKLMAAASERNLVSKRGALMDGKLVAACVFFHSNHEYIFLFSATDDKAKETGAMSAMIDHFIQQHVGENMKIDFEGSMDAGVSRFYHSFGAGEVVYLHVRKNRLPYLLKWMKRRR
jgi:hypothetical protein